MLKLNEIYHGDCLKIMKEIDDHSIDMIMSDPPYGTTACEWDSIIPLNEMWSCIERIIKPNGAIVITAAQPFTSLLINSNLKMFKYELIWEKTRAVDFFNAKNKPLKKHENIVIFSKSTCANCSDKKMKYNPQNLIKCDNVVDGTRKGDTYKGHKLNRDSHKQNHYQEYTNYPHSILKFNSASNIIHPTQKPVKLFEYLIKTYTDENNLVLDFCVGSGTTGIACLNTNRNFILIEKDDEYFNRAKNRINEHKSKNTLKGLIEF